MGRGKGRQTEMNGVRRRGGAQVPLPGSDGAIYPVTPGLIDADSRAAYLHGQCHALALALNETTGWDIWGSQDGELDIVHVAVRAPDGRFLDITGLHAPKDYLKLDQNDLVMDLDFFEPLDAEEVRAYAEDPDWRDPDVETARSFVMPLLEMVGLDGE